MRTKHARGGRNGRDRTRIEDMEIKMVGDGTDLFIVAAGVKITKRGRPNTPYAKTWVSLEPGWRVFDDRHSMVVEYKPNKAQ
jgi:hypothetical protein